MKRLDRLTGVLLLVAGLGSEALMLSAFFVHVPIRAGSHNLVRSSSGGYVEAPVLPQTYFQKYGTAELLLFGLGLLLVLAVAAALRERRGRGLAGAGRLAWSLSITGLVIGIVGSVTIAPYLLLVGILLVFACSAFSRSGAAASPHARSAPVVNGAAH